MTEVRALLPFGTGYFSTHLSAIPPKSMNNQRMFLIPEVPLWQRELKTEMTTNRKRKRILYSNERRHNSNELKGCDNDDDVSNISKLF